MKFYNRLQIGNRFNYSPSMICQLLIQAKIKPDGVRSTGNQKITRTKQKIYSSKSVKKLETWIANNIKRQQKKNLWWQAKG